MELIRSVCMLGLTAALAPSVSSGAEFAVGDRYTGNMSVGNPSFDVGITMEITSVDNDTVRALVSRRQSFGSRRGCAGDFKMRGTLAEGKLDIKGRGVADCVLGFTLRVEADRLVGTSYQGAPVELTKQ